MNELEIFVCTTLSINALGGVDKLCVCLHQICTEPARKSRWLHMLCASVCSVTA